MNIEGRSCEQKRKRKRCEPIDKKSIFVRPAGKGVSFMRKKKNRRNKNEVRRVKINIIFVFQSIIKHSINPGESIAFASETFNNLRARTFRRRLLFLLLFQLGGEWGGGVQSFLELNYFFYWGLTIIISRGNHKQFH